MLLLVVLVELKLELKLVVLLEFKLVVSGVSGVSGVVGVVEDESAFCGWCCVSSNSKYPGERQL